MGSDGVYRIVASISAAIIWKLPEDLQSNSTLATDTTFSVYLKPFGGC